VSQVGKEKVYEIIFRKIQKDITEGKLAVGDKMPSERELAAQYQVSRTSIREAMRVLELGDVVEIRQGDGTFIKNVTFSSIKDKLAHVLTQSDKALLYEMLELRLILESQCAALAAMRATSQDIRQIAKALEMMKQAREDEALGVQSDLDFHLAIAEATHNTVLQQLISSLTPHVRNTIEATRRHRLVSSDHYEQTFEEHKAIYIAISRGDSDVAKELMENHIRRIRQEISELSI